MAPTSSPISWSFVSILLILLNVVTADSANTFTSPTDGTVISAGSVVNIQWTSLQGNLISIWLRRADPGISPIAQSVVQGIANTGTFTWTLDINTPEAIYFFEISTEDDDSASDTTYGPEFHVSSNVKLATIGQQVVVATTVAGLTATPTSSSNASTQSSMPSSSAMAGDGRPAIIVITILVAMLLAAGAVMLLQHICSKRKSGYKPIGFGRKRRIDLLGEKIKTNIRSHNKEIKPVSLVNPVKALKSVHFRMSDTAEEKERDETPPPYRIAQTPSGSRYQKLSDTTPEAPKTSRVALDLNKDLPIPPDYSHEFTHQKV